MFSKCIIGFDFGMRYIGVAVGELITMKATPCANILAVKGEPIWIEITKLVKTWNPQTFVVGVPVHLDGTKHEMTFAATQFIKKLENRFDIPVYPAEERLTSVEARARLFEIGGAKLLRKSAIDGLAAQLILEGWLQEYHTPHF